jgi:hypothetical protein
MRPWLLVLALAGCWERQAYDLPFCNWTQPDGGVADCPTADDEKKILESHCGLDEVEKVVGPTLTPQYSYGPFGGGCCYMVTWNRGDRESCSN